MSTRVPAVVVTASILLGLAACGSADDTEASGSTAPAATETTTAPPTTAAETMAYESTGHPYRVEIPADWQLSSVDGTWTSLDQFAAGDEVRGEEVLGSPDRATFLVVNSMVLPAGQSPEQWNAAFEAAVGETVFEGCTRTRGEGTVDGEPAVVLEDACDGDVLVGRSLVHGGRGWYFTSRGAGDPDTTALLDAVAASIEFTES